MARRLIEWVCIAALLVAATPMQPKTAEEWFHQGNQLGRELKHREAVEAYRESLRLTPEKLVVFYNLGLALKALKDFPQAETAILNVLRLEPDNLDARLTLGNLYNFMERWEDAIAHLNMVVDQRPEDAEAHGNLGWAMYNYKTGPPFKLLVIKHLERAADLLEKQGHAQAAQATRQTLEEARKKFGLGANSMI